MKCRSSASRENCARDPGEEREVRASKALPTHLSPNNHEALARKALQKALIVFIVGGAHHGFRVREDVHVER